MSDTSDGQGPNGAQAPPATTGAVTPTPLSAGAPGDVQVAKVRRGGTVAGIVLIIIGLLVLLGQITSFDGILRLWPLLIVAGGIASLVRPRREGGLVLGLVRATTTVVVGLVLLANTLGYLGWNVWLAVFSLWPLLVIAWGLELLGRGTGQRWLSVVGALLVLAGLLFGALVLGPQRTPMTWFPFGGTAGTTAFHTTVAHDPAVTQGDASIKVGATELVVGAGSELASIEGRAPTGEAPALTSTTTSGTADVEVTEPNTSGFRGVGGQSLAVTLDRAATWRSVGLQVGAIDGRIDLSDLDVRAVSLDSGASQVALTLGTRSPDVSVQVQGGAADITVRVPASAAVTLDAKSGLSDVTVPRSLTRVAGAPLVGESRWQGAGAGGPRIDISVQSGVSSITLQTY